MKLPLNIGDAYTQRAEGRWWVFHWTPAGMIVRLLLSYPDKASAVRAIGMLGYRMVDQPVSRETVRGGEYVGGPR